MAEKKSRPNDSNNGNKDKKNRRRKPDSGDKFEWRKATRTLTFWILLIIGSWIIFRQLSFYDQSEVQRSFTQYQKLLDSGQIDGAEIIDREFHGRLKDGSSIVTTLPFIDAKMLAVWDSIGIDYQFKEKTTSWIGYLITSILPWIIILGIWLYFLRRMQGGGARGMFSFGKSRAKLLVENKPSVTFKDVAGVLEAKEELEEIIAFLRDPKKFTRLGGRIPKGALLLGPPGTGKTLLARAVAGEAEVPFYSMSGADFVEMFVGVGAARVRDLFEQGKKSAPCIIFIDEIDAVGRHRGAGLGGGHDEREQTLNQLLVEMDGFEGSEGVILIAATNRPDVLDPALTRPGRFDRQIVVDRPDVRGREGILKVHSRNIPLHKDVNLAVLAKGTPGLAGADLANLVNESALIAARRNAKRVTMEDFESAKDKVMMGTERKSMVISDTEKKQTAYHEAGHVLVAKLTPGSDPVHKVTIIPRGRALGLTHYLPIDEKHSYSKTYLQQTLCHLLGGRAAEKLIFKELSTGAGNDIERATQIARKMVCEWGMSEKLGPVSWGKSQGEVFLGRDYAQQKDYSERTALEIDNEVRRIVKDAMQKSEQLLRENRDKLSVLADALLEREILDGSEIDLLLQGQKLPPVKPKKTPRRPAPRRRSSRGRKTTRSTVSRSKTAAGETSIQTDTKTKKRASQSGRKSTGSKSIPTSRQSQSGGEKRRPAQTKRSTGAGTSSSAKKTTSLSKENTKTETRTKRSRTNTPPTGPRSRQAREYGVISSRDPENQRPKASLLAKEDFDKPEPHTSDIKSETKSEIEKKTPKTRKTTGSRSSKSGVQRSARIRIVPKAESDEKSVDSKSTISEQNQAANDKLQRHTWKPYETKAVQKRSELLDNQPPGGEMFMSSIKSPSPDETESTELKDSKKIPKPESTEIETKPVSEDGDRQEEDK